MTENNWPHDSSGARAAVQQADLRQADLRQASTFPPAPSSSTDRSSTNGAAATTDAAKEEAGEVARRAADSAQNVAETAKTEAANVAAEVKTNARDLLHQAKSDLTEQAGTQQQKVAEGLRSISTELRTMASASDQPGVATDLVRQAAERSSAVASWLDDRDPGSLLTEVKSFARQRPGSFLMLAAGAGILAGRLSRSLSAGAPEPAGNPAVGGPAAPVTRVPDTGMAVPPPPVQMPAPETTTAGFADMYPPNPLDAGAAGGAHQQDRWASEPVVDGPLQPADPLHEDPFDGGRR
ncbi:hypothetical protein BJG92_02501 [Arthrobacter sp. SO5]|uniref:hypothetical protein n=1 Tax=Arthrobacter sp. SO5 TaxID=1897055 RepID=UPI001E4B17E1|nr:hypothetical protein [Arthrobacter sp. SO5]MCB5274963.1 hypothetical protein [Arthrobacter sp. SO5]